MPRTDWSTPALNFTRSQSLHIPRPTTISDGLPADRMVTVPASRSGRRVRSKLSVDRSRGWRGPGSWVGMSPPHPDGSRTTFSDSPAVTSALEKKVGVPSPPRRSGTPMPASIRPRPSDAG